jgi:F-type H+-transporting ATPase subunit b
MLSSLIQNDEFWVALAFLLVVVAAWRPMKARLQAMLDERAVQIEKELAQAQSLREEAERTLAEYQQKQRDALAQVDEIIAQAREEAANAAERARHELAAALDRRRRLAAERIILEEQKALSEVRNVAVDIAIAAVRQILLSDLDETRRAALVDQAIEALPRQLSH